MSEWKLPPPRFLACDVGSSIYERAGKVWHTIEEYRGIVREALGLQAAAELLPLLSDLPGLLPQEHERQGEFKASFYVDVRYPKDQVLQGVEKVLREKKIRGSLVFSIDPLKGQGLLDVLPRGVNKGSALSFLAERLDLPPERVLFAGDSGNDREALRMPYLGVLVGNAPHLLRQVLGEEVRGLGLEKTLHFAEARYSDGVLEALDHFTWLEAEEEDR